MTLPRGVGNQDGGHHDWHSAAYVGAWISRDVTRDDERRPVLREMVASAPFPADADVSALDIGGGYGIVTEEVLRRFPRARVTLLDYSEPMFAQARKRLTPYGSRVAYVCADLATPEWTVGLVGGFEVAVSAIAIHNLAGQRPIAAIYAETLTTLKPGGVFLNYDLVSFTGGLRSHLGWLRKAGFVDVRSTWREGPTAVLQGVVPLGRSRDAPHPLREKEET